MPPDSSADGAFRIVTDPDLHLRADGERILPTIAGGAAVFRLARPHRELWLMSRASRPVELGINGDGRLLGYRLVRVDVVRGQERIAIPLDHPALGEGLHPLEASGARWTNGGARLLPALLEGGAFPAELHVVGSPLARYRDIAARESALLSRFEGLGDDCEFGLVQRAYNVEPMSLLRWAGTDASRLVLGLCRRFEGLGDPAATRVEWASDVQEYRLRDRRYLSMHTWNGVRTEDPERLHDMLVAGCARMRLLRRKLLADIEGARRIFVFKQTAPNARREPLHAVHAALRSVGPAPLLCVVRAEQPADVGRVEELGDGWYLGHIDTFDRLSLPFAGWMRICTATAALIDGQGTATGMSTP